MRTSKERIYSDEELRAMIPKMRAVSDDFYGPATRAGNHAFIEFCGLMNEYIAMCSYTLECGEDFTCANRHVGQPLRAADYQIKYLAEKFECIFGPLFEDKKNRKIFERAMGWSQEETQPLVCWKRGEGFSEHPGWQAPMRDGAPWNCVRCEAPRPQDI